MHRFVAALLAAASCAGVAQAQTSPPVEAGEVLTLDSALAQAGVSSPQAEAAAAGIRAAEAGRTVAGLRPNPSVSAQSENVVGSGPYRGFDQAETTVTFSMPLELGGKRGARIGVADARIGRAELEAAITRADVRLRVTQAYIEAVAADRRLTIARDQLRIANESLRVARDRVMVGESSPIDEQRTSVAQINAQTGLERAERGFQVARDNLALLLGQPLAGTFDQAWFDRVRAVGPDVRPTADGTLAYAAARADLLIADANVRLARSQRVPDLTLSAGARRLSATGDTAAVLGISVPLPFFNNGRASVSQANAERNQAGARQRAVKLDAEQDIAIVQRDRDNAAASVRASGPALAAAMEAARIARLGYGQGKFDQLVLLDAERTLAETRNAAVDALAQYHDAEARLARLIAPAPASSGDNQ
ncbi:MAG: TolC family protein [Pseudomonadota bacterium]|jgi:cobalt-zinc-cadmium efflux system outer membrane protein|uniref:Heavy metal RND efflux outer membrane protein,CzcC family n=1 Tax=hydrothermal vent metagenome TaxID=652676 RepID=A0A160TKA9_9ZZZZ